VFKVKDIKQPSSLSEALEMLAADSNLMPLAGGTDIIPKMHKQPHIEQLKSGDPAPPSTREEVVLLNLSNIEELFGLTAENHQIKIGALTTHTEIAINQLIKTYFPILAEAAAVIGSVQIRNRGTIGGNIVKYVGEIINTTPKPEVNFFKIAVYAFIWWLKEQENLTDRDKGEET